MRLTLILDNIRSTYNVGAILRTAEGFGVERVILSGYTPRVHDAKLLPHLREKLDREIHKTALGAEDMLDIYACDDIIQEVAQLKKEGHKIVGLENNITADNLYRLDDANLPRILGEKVVLILGEEVHGIDYSLHDIIDLFVEIPMQGRKESFNVSVAAGIAMWGIRSIDRSQCRENSL
ncbi:TrmH family RNA methyltransferase [Candidatus Saccharibacteria bacterium]|nr:TrmH family RNA methyltransferase [Candidatus Saccharibacteria bacterium]